MRIIPSTRVWYVAHLLNVHVMAVETRCELCGGSSIDVSAAHSIRMVGALTHISNSRHYTGLQRWWWRWRWRWIHGRCGPRHTIFTVSWRGGEEGVMHHATSCPLIAIFKQPFMRLPTVVTHSPTTPFVLAGPHQYVDTALDIPSSHRIPCWRRRVSCR